MRSMVSLLALLTGMLLTAAHAQEIPVPFTETVAVQQALQHQPTLQAAQAQVGMAQARIGQARSEGHLQLSGNGLAAASSMRNVLAVPVIMPQALLQSQQRSSLDVNGMAMLPLYTGGRIHATIRSAQFSAAAAQAQLRAARVQIAADARTHYAQWQQSLAMQSVAEDTLAAQMKNAQVTQQLFAAGKVAQFDLLRAQAAQADAQQQVTNAQAEVTVARAQLAQALGVAMEALPMQPAEQPPAAPPVNALDTALARRPDLLAAQQAICAAQAALEARKAAYHPQLYAVGMVDALAPADMGKSTGVTVGVVAGVPILTGGQRKAEIGEDEQAILQANAERAALELQVRAEVIAADARVIAARKILRRLPHRCRRRSQPTPWRRRAMREERVPSWNCSTHSARRRKRGKIW